MNDLQIAITRLCQTEYPKIYELIQKLVDLGQTPAQIDQRIKKGATPTIRDMIRYTARQLYQERK